jgi:hypothetical protein
VIAELRPRPIELTKHFAVIASIGKDVNLDIRG